MKRKFDFFHLCCCMTLFLIMVFMYLNYDIAAVVVADLAFLLGVLAG